MKAFFTHTGLKEMRGKIQHRVENQAKEFGKAMRKVMDTEVELEMKPRTPVLTGDLKSTVRAQGPFYSGNLITVQAVAGGLAESGRMVDYAVPVHENLDAHHPNGEAKFIERPLMESAPFFLQRTAHQMGTPE